MANQIGVINLNKNKSRVIMVDEGSFTHRQAVNKTGNWRLANEAETTKANEQKKKVVESVDVKDEAPLAEGEQGSETDTTESEKANEQPAQEAPLAEKPKRGGNKKKENK